MWVKYVLEGLRVYINDIVEPYTYEDFRLERVIYLAAFQVSREVDFTSDYSINIVTQEISPDPTTDGDFLLLTILKAMCIISKGDVRANMDCNIKITNGPSSVDTGGKYLALKDYRTESCKDYDKAKEDYRMGEGSIGKAILTPYSPGDQMIRGIE